MQTLKTHVSKGTWLGVPGISTTYTLDRRRYGLRVNVLELEGLPADVSLIEGDGRRADFKVHCAGQS